MSTIPTETNRHPRAPTQQRPNVISWFGGSGSHYWAAGEAQSLLLLEATRRPQALRLRLPLHRPLLARLLPAPVLHGQSEADRVRLGLLRGPLVAGTERAARRCLRRCHGCRPRAVYAVFSTPWHAYAEPSTCTFLPLTPRPWPLSSSSPPANRAFGPLKSLSTIDCESSFLAIMTGAAALNCGRAITTAGAACTKHRHASN